MRRVCGLRCMTPSLVGCACNYKVGRICGLPMRSARVRCLSGRAGISAAIRTRGDHPMRKIIATEFMSLDGVIDSPGGDNDFVRGAWTFKFSDPEGMQFKVDETMGSG